MEIPDGFCQCGCGDRTSIIKYNWKEKGLVKGMPRKFIRSHNFKGQSTAGDRNPNWKGGRSTSDGRHAVYVPGHPRANSWGYVLEHVVIAEKVLGKPLPKKVVVHHADQNFLNNTNSNLVICENTKYHALLHRRLRALQKCGHADYIKCSYCKKYHPPQEMLHNRANRSYYKKECENIDHKQRRQKAVVQARNHYRKKGVSDD